MKKKILLFIFALFIGLLAFDNIEAKLICEYDQYKLIFYSGDSLDNTMVYKENKLLNDVYVDFDKKQCPEKLYITDVGGILISVEPYDLIQPDKIEDLKKQNKIDPVFFTCKYGKYEIVFDMSDDFIESTIVYVENIEYVYPNAIVNFKKNKCPTNIDILDIGFLSIDTNTDVFDDRISLSSYKTYCGSGEGIITNIPGKIPELTSMIFTIVQVAVPIILVIMGSIDLFKGITSGKEDEMKKGRQMFLKRLIVGAIIFLIGIIVKLIISIVADTGVDNIVDCIDCFISNKCGGV